MSLISHETLLSPRIRKLAADLAQGDAGVMEAFWREVEERTTPLIEPVEGRDDVVLLTFLWRAIEPVRNVALFENFSVRDPEGTPLERLSETDVYFRTFVAMSDLRLTYEFSINDSLLPVYEDPNSGERWQNLQPDPLNPRTATLDYLVGTEEEPTWSSAISFVELPDVPPAPYLEKRADVPVGNVTTHHFASEILGDERTLWIYEPVEVSTVDSLHVLLIFDGSAARDALGAPVTLDNLHSDRAIPPTLAVMVENLDRCVELPCNAAFADMLADELIPWVRSRYRIGEGPEVVTACGVSYGGLGAAWVGLKRPDGIGNALCLSGSFQWREGHGHIARDLFSTIGEAPDYGWLPNWAARQEGTSSRFWITAGRFEAHNDGVEPSLTACSRQMRDVLIAKGHDVHYHEFGGGHEYVNWRALLPEGLIHLSTRLHVLRTPAWFFG